MLSCDNIWTKPRLLCSFTTCIPSCYGGSYRKSLTKHEDRGLLCSSLNAYLTHFMINTLNLVECSPVQGLSTSILLNCDLEVKLAYRIHPSIHPSSRQSYIPNQHTMRGLGRTHIDGSHTPPHSPFINICFFFFFFSFFVFLVLKLMASSKPWGFLRRFVLPL